MTSIQFLLLALALDGVGALVSLLVSRQASRVVAAFFSLLGSFSGVVAVILLLTGNSTPRITLFTLPPFGELALQLDALSALLVLVISLLGIATSLYSVGEAPELVSVGFFGNLFMMAMILVVTITNGFFFLLFWELMTLTSYFLVVWEFDKKESVQTGYIYFLATHAGAALLMIAFFLFFQQAHTFDFERFRSVALSPLQKNLIFVLAFLGFGVKSGIVPLHFWLPRAHPAAPSHISSLMSGVMIKTGIYGILRICMDLLGGSVWWWGFTVLTFGTLSAVFGAFYALTEHDIKKVLAYSSIENIGIILMGVGLGMLGISLQQPVLAALGFLAALYHLLNHAFFKGMLFLGAGAVIKQTGTHDLNQMGGLNRCMPWTALAFLIGALAVTAMPPLNGFVSEWFTYQALLNAARTDLFALRVFAPLFGVLLAMAGAIAVMVYIKVYGGAFAGPTRDKNSAHVREASLTTLISMGYLALGIIVLGVGSPWIAPRIAAVAADLANLPAIAVKAGWSIYPGDPLTGIVSPPLVALLLLSLLVVPVIVVAAYGGWRISRRSNVEPWACGYGYQEPMSVRASSFDQPVKISFQPLYWIRTILQKPYRAINKTYVASIDAVHRAEPVLENTVTRPTLKFVETAGHWIQALQMGDIRLYCLYIIITLAILLIVLFGRSGL
jgi:hydrogenase-4 component B